MIRVKICGITSVADALAAIEAGADSLGLNFYGQSPRHITVADAAQIRAQIPRTVETVGVFVNIPSAEVLKAARRGLDAQLHGDESPRIVAGVSRQIPVIKAFRADTDFAIETLDLYPDAYAFLLDASQAGQYGGTGHTTDWDLARRAASAHRIILAGGLKPENVAAAIRVVRPWAVDVASGVESQPGKKDRALIREFIQAVREADKQLDSPAEQSNTL
jgi:phosphoribosylanthranilate isomerase